MKLRAIKDRILASDIQTGTYTKNGLIILDDDGKERGIHPRWCCVYEIGPDVRDLSVGQWILVEHGRWSRGVDVTTDDGKKTIRVIDGKAILLVTDEKPF